MTRKSKTNTVALAMKDQKKGGTEPATSVVVRKHTLATRWMHWLNFPFLAVMVWSGLAIYWADTDADGTHFHQVYRIGIGSWTLVRFFPDWFFNHLGMQYGLAKGLSYHFALMWLFVLNGIVYSIYLAASGEWRWLLPERGTLRAAWQVFLHDLHLRRSVPLAEKYNGAQRIAYTLIILIAAAEVVTGLAIYKPAQLGWLTHLLGGYQSAKWMHFWLMMSIVGFFVIHVWQVIRAGWSNFRSMVTGLETVRTDAEESEVAS
jgi:thiosulfate reductase cytochrome b subunit